MFAALIDLLPAFARLMGLGGAVEGAGMRIGLSEAAASHAAKQFGKETIEGEVVGREIEGKATTRGSERVRQEMMRHWVVSPSGTVKPGRGVPTGQTMPVAGQGGQGGQPPNRPPVPNTGSITPGQPAPGGPNQTTQLMRQHNQLLQRANQQQQTQNRQQQSWIGQQVKSLIVQQLLFYAGYKLSDMFSTKLGPAVNKVASLFHMMTHPLETSIRALLFVERAGVKLFDFAESISESNRALGRFNGVIAGSFARLEMRKTVMQVQTAREVEPSTVFLNEQIGDVLEEIRPIGSAMTTLTNSLGVLAAMGAKGLSILFTNSMTGKIIVGLAKTIEQTIKDFIGIKPVDPNLVNGLRELQMMRPVGTPGQRRPNLPGAIPRQPLPPPGGGKKP
jgi:hypothetical protein